jgi:aryl-alcohol dehydrogenase-like predicted oxidoreductase
MVKLKKTDLEISPVVFGAWAIGGWMWGGADRKEAVKALQKSVELGITTIDTAPVYGFGLSEEIIGEALGKRRNDIQILTKFGLSWTKKEGQHYFTTTDNSGKKVDIYKFASKKRIIEECEESLQCLGTDYIDLYQQHWPDPTTPVEETMEALNDLIAKGKIRAAGVSNYDVSLLDTACKFTGIVSDQVPYSMLRRDIEQELIPYCIEHDIDILAYSPLQRGILTGKFSPDHRFKEGDSRDGQPWYKKKNIVKINAFLEKLKKLAVSKNSTLTQLVLKWTLMQPGITAVLAGARDPKQLTENAGAMNLKLEENEMDYINKEIKDLHLTL